MYKPIGALPLTNKVSCLSSFFWGGRIEKSGESSWAMDSQRCCDSSVSLFVEILLIIFCQKISIPGHSEEFLGALTAAY